MMDPYWTRVLYLDNHGYERICSGFRPLRVATVPHKELIARHDLDIARYDWVSPYPMAVHTLYIQYSCTCSFIATSGITTVCFPRNKQPSQLEVSSQGLGTGLALIKCCSKL